MILRPAALADAERLPAVERSAAEAFRGHLHGWIADDTVAEPAFHAPLIEAGTVWVAEIDGEIAGSFPASRWTWCCTSGNWMWP